MGKKELWQIGWAGGQTEGDLSKQTVKEILNSEINILGTLTPRDELIHQVVDDESITNAIDLKFMTNPSDPSETLSVYLTSTHVLIRGATTTKDVALDVTIDDDSEMIIVEGNNIYIAAIVSGDPYGIISITYTGAGTRFRAPENLFGHPGNAELVGTQDEWIKNEPEGLVPLLTRIELSATHIAQTKVLLDAAPDRSIVVGTYANRSFTATGLDDFPIAVSLGIEIAVQFEFQNGDLSQLSDTKTFSYTTEADDKERSLSIGLSLAVSRNISKTVKRVHLYRRVRELDGEHYFDVNPLGLLYSANILSEDLADEVVEVSDSTIYLGAVETGDANAPHGHTHYGEFTTLDGARETYQYRFLDSGEVKETTGWLQYDTNAMFYWPRCVIFDGRLNINVVDKNDQDNWYTMEYAISQGVFTWPSNTGSFVSVFQNNHVKDGDSYGPYVDVDVATKTVFPLQEIGKVGEPNLVHGYGPDICPYMINTTAFPAYTVHKSGSGALYTGTAPQVTDLEALTCYVDIGDARLVSVDDLTGFSQNERSIVKPRHIAVSSGRMLMLNVIQDDKYRVSRLCYSEFRKYLSVAESNYVDYEARDDGIGVGIAEFKGRVLILHSTSAYIMDISGGAGMSWRELGAYNEINALGRPAIVETPFGAFFGGQDFAYLFDGNRVQNISETPERRISKAYRKMVSRGTPSFAWRSDLRQLWIISLADDAETSRRLDALVYDADTASWHYHLFDELVSTTTTPLDFMAISNQGGVEYLFANENNATIQKFGLNDATIVRPFSWGINTGQINMGSSEFQKKLKRIYIDTKGKIDDDGNKTYGKLFVTVDGFTQDFEPKTDRHVTRVSSSNKNYYIDFGVYAESAGGESWTGTIESLGLSYKPKKLK